MCKLSAKCIFGFFAAGAPQLIPSRFHGSGRTLIVGNRVAVEQPDQLFCNRNLLSAFPLANTQNYSVLHDKQITSENLKSVTSYDTKITTFGLLASALVASPGIRFSGEVGEGLIPKSFQNRFASSRFEK